MENQYLGVDPLSWYVFLFCLTQLAQNTSTTEVSNPHPF
jgi:hypothetical protein